MVSELVRRGWPTPSRFPVPVPEGPGGLEGGEVGVRRGDGFGVRRPLLVFGQGPVDAGQARVLPFAPACVDDQVGLDLLDRLAACTATEHGVQHVIGDDRRAAAVLALAGGGVEPLQR